MLKESVALEYADEEREESYYMLRKALDSIIILLSPLSASSLNKLLGIKKEAINQTLNDLLSILDALKDQSQPPVFTIHRFEITSSASNSERFPSKTGSVGRKVTQRLP